jgi:hypothetical protein
MQVENLTEISLMVNLSEADAAYSSYFAFKVVDNCNSCFTSEVKA